VAPSQESDKQDSSSSTGSRGRIRCLHDPPADLAMGRHSIIGSAEKEVEYTVGQRESMVIGNVR